MPKKKADIESIVAEHIADAQADPKATLSFAEALRAAAANVEQAAIKAALEREGGFESQAAKVLGIARTSLLRKMKPGLAEAARQQRQAQGYTSGPRPKPADLPKSAAIATKRPTPVGDKRKP